MKMVFKIFTIVLICINVHCQTLPLKTPNFDCPNGAYKKDLDNVFPFWVDTWKGIVDNKEYTFEFVSFTYQMVSFSNGDNFYEDMLKCKFKVVDLTNNQILYNDLHVTNITDFKIKLISYRNNSDFFFLFNDDESNCYNTVEFFFTKNPLNPDQLFYEGFEYKDFIPTENCTFSNSRDIPIFLPTRSLTLIRQ
jgi:hypothetical protein